MAKHTWTIGEPITALKMNELEEQAYKASSVEYEYAVSSTNEIPTEGWTTQFPMVRQGTYLWTRIKGHSQPISCSYWGTDGVKLEIVGVMYAIGQDGINEPTSGWQSEKPPLNKGEWLWVKTEYSDGNTITTCSYAGLDGAGADTTVQSVEYAVADSGETIPTSNWSGTFPIVSKGMWLWIRTTYSNNTKAYSVSYIGEDGAPIAIQNIDHVDGNTIIKLVDGTGEISTIELENGKDGKDGYDGENGYVHIAWANSPDGSIDFSRDESADKEYMGVYTDNELEDSNDYRRYNWTKIKGENGASVSIAAIEYARGANGVTIPVDGWTNSVPALEKGTWLWCRTTYSNNEQIYSCSYVGTDGQDGKSVRVQSATKDDGTTTVRLIDDEGNLTTLEIEDGRDGTNGLPGANGYIHIAWANSADGTANFSTVDNAGKLYMGVYSDLKEEDSEEPSDYSWTLIKGVSVVGITEFYKANNSIDTIPEEPYQNTPIAPTSNNRYIWNYEMITYSDGSYFKSDKHIISMFSEAANGRGVSSIKEYYAATNSMMAPQDSEFSTIVAAPTSENRYLWNYEVVHYTDGEDEPTEKRIIGVYGEKGDPGNSTTIISTSAFYNASEDGTTAPEDGWQTTIPSVEPGKYLWTRTDTNYSNGTVSSSYSVARQGINGIAVSVKSTVVEYQQSTDGTTPPTGNWTTTPPNAVSGRYMWSRTTTTYTDDNISIGYNVAKNGTNGINTATIMLYQRSIDAPTNRPNQLTYIFNTGEMSTSFWGGWSQTIPDGIIPCWVIAATASSTGTQDIIESNEWSAPIKFIDSGDGDSGAGINQATLYLYKRAKTLPTKPTSQATYTFATGELTSVANWERAIPEGTLPCWVITAAAINTEGTDTIEPNEWSTPVKIVDKSVVKVETEYYLSSNNTSQSGGSWTTEQPDWQPNHYIWTRTITYWSDETTTESTPILANALNKANENAYEATSFGKSIQKLTNDVVELQNQIDGNITSWFYAGAPSSSNLPASEWTTDDDKNLHLGDLYYDSSNGFCYRWQLSNNEVYEWILIRDTDITQALSKAEQAQDTADNKRRVFVTQPTPPYDIGDLWVQGTSGDILRCSRAKASSGTYNLSDWIKCSKYTDDTAVTELNTSLNQDEIFNRLTNNGAAEGIYFDENKKLYVNGTYIKAGSISTDRLTSATQKSLIKSSYTIPQYYLSNSSTSRSGGSWQNSQTWSEGKFLWIRYVTVTTYADDTTDTQYNPSSSGRYDANLTNALKTAYEAKNAASATPQAAANAMAREQLIFIQGPSGTLAEDVAKPGSWINRTTESIVEGLSEPQWTTKRPTYNTNYPITFMTTQRETVTGTYSCSDVTIDDSMTVIDGGHITTGSIDANLITTNKIKASQIDASQLHVNAANIDGTLTIGQLNSNIRESINNAETNASDALNAANAANNKAVVFRGICTTSSSATNPHIKVVTCESFPTTLTNGISITVYMGYANTIANTTLQLQVGSSNAKDIYVNGAATSSENQLLWGAGAIISFTYYGGYWRIENKPSIYYGTTCSVTASTPKKTTTVNNAILFKGTSVYVPMTNENTSDKPILAIGSGGTNLEDSRYPQYIYYGTSKNAPNNTTNGWLARKVAFFTFDGSAWRLSEGATIIDGGSIKTGSIDAGLIKSGTIDGDSVNAKKLTIVDSNNKDIAQFDSTIKLGKDGSSYAIIAPHSFELYDSANVSHLFVGDLRGDVGYAPMKEVFYGGNNQKDFYVSQIIDSIIEVTIDGTATNNYSYSSAIISFSSAPPTDSKIIVKYNTKAPVYYYSFGKRKGNNDEIGSDSLVEGKNNTASGYCGHAEGQDTLASGQNSHSEGYNTKAQGEMSHAEGLLTKANGDESHAEGLSSSTAGQAAHAEGYNSSANGEASHAEGHDTIASGEASHTEGSGTRASNSYAHAEGSSTQAIEYAAHSEGLSSKASGLGAHAEGNLTIASGPYSHAEGDGTEATASASHAEGSGTIANGPNQHVFGTYNIADNSSLEIVGNGTRGDRHNARKLDSSGNETLAGTLYLGSPLGIPYGGTGATTAAAARTSLGLRYASSGAWYNAIPYIGSNGVMEIGCGIDFHGSETDTTDYDTRLYANTDGTFRILGKTLFNNPITIENTNGISYKAASGTLSMIRFKEGNSSGHGIIIGGGGLTVIGGGESASSVANLSAYTADNEYLFLCSDTDIRFFTNVQNEQNDAALATETKIDTYGNFSGKAANVTGTVAIANGGTGATDRLNGFKNLAFLGNDITNSSSNDTRAFWGNKPGYTYIENTGMINGQPWQWGFITNITNGANEIHQLWHTQGGNGEYYRCANGQTTAMPTWTRLIDSKMILSKTITATTNTNGNMDFGLAHSRYYILSVRESGGNNYIITPFGASGGNWWGHVTTNSTTPTAQTGKSIIAVVLYYDTQA